MASTAVHIPNMLAAIADGTVPGGFNEDRTEFAFPTLEYTGARGTVRSWSIRVRLLRGDEYVEITDEMLDQPSADLAGDRAEITVESAQRDGKVRDVVPTYVSAGKNLGKKNATNALTQALRDALGLYNKQRKRADTVVSEDAVSEDAVSEDAVSEPAVNDRMPPPMLVKKIGDSREATLTPEVFRRGVTAQRKFDGVHLVVFNDAAEGVTLYSRTGTKYPGQPQIVAEMGAMYRTAPRVVPGKYGLPALLPTMSPTPATLKALEAYGSRPDQDAGPSDPYFDGELYLHGKKLNWISGQARRDDDEGELEFYVFDVFFPRAKAAGHDMASRDRQRYLDDFFAAAAPHPHIRRVENFPASSRGELDALAQRFLREGYEGAIARKDDAGYKYSYSNYHSANLVKIKPVFDDEFPVVGFTQGDRGKDVGAVIWVCEVPRPVDPADKTFTVVPKDMTYADRYAVFECLGRRVPGPDGKPTTRFERDIRGLALTVEYRGLSPKTGKPLQAKAKAFRTYESGPGVDPIRKLLAECAAEE
jgi:ATP-dependent DNA ligase